VPLVQNTRMPPMPSLTRSHKVGQMLGEVLRSASGGTVAVLGTGGLSHWVGDERRRQFLEQPAGTRFGHEQEFPLVLGEQGQVNEEFDKEFLGVLQRGDADRFVRDWSNERVQEVGGNGAQEIRNWLLVAGVARDAPLEVLAYAPVPEWHTGSAVGQFRL
jgi:2,3-dihydroxyphenylpropionate 1,2-dioxygenase